MALLPKISASRALPPPSPAETDFIHCIFCFQTDTKHFPGETFHFVAILQAILVSQYPEVPVGEHAGWEQLTQPLWGPASNGHTMAAGGHGAESEAGQAALPLTVLAAPPALLAALLCSFLE